MRDTRPYRNSWYRTPRTMNEAFGPYARLHAPHPPSRVRVWFPCLIGALALGALAAIFAC